MDTFQIHQDFKKRDRVNKPQIIILENITQKHGSKIPIKNNVPAKADKKCVEKKTFLSNRGVFQPQENIIKKDDTKIKALLEINPKEEKHVNNTNPSLVEEPLLQIEKENQLVGHTTRKEMFPLSLLYNVEYREEIWTYLKNLEKKMPTPNPGYMKKQTEINWESRRILIDWLANVSENYNFCNESFHLCVNYIDRFLSNISVARNKFQLLGAAAMMLATKMEEYYPIDAKEWAYLTENTFSYKQVLKMEQVVLKVLKYKMQAPTVNNFIQMLVTEHKMEEKTLYLAMYIGELVLLEGDDYLQLVPSMLASACVALARFTLGKRVTWPKNLKKVSGYCLKELSPILQRQNKTLKDSSLMQQKTIQSKYKDKKFNNVALIRPRKLILEELE